MFSAPMEYTAQQRRTTYVARMDYIVVRRGVLAVMAGMLQLFQTKPVGI